MHKIQIKEKNDKSTKSKCKISSNDKRKSKKTQIYKDKNWIKLNPTFFS